MIQMFMEKHQIRTEIFRPGTIGEIGNFFPADTAIPAMCGAVFPC